ncbi:MAG TPA: mechanosensitive ion channel domain-containing protein [Desulfuromonadaceae bacterium]|jgi:small-conductance mechanosensitive channel
MQELFIGLRGWETTLFSFGLIFIAFMVGLVLYGLIFHFLDRSGQQGRFFIDHRMVLRWVSPARVLLPLLMIVAVAPYLRFHEEITAVIRHIFALALIAAGTWLLVNTTLGLQDIILSRYDLMVKDNLRAREIHTKINVLVKIFLVVLLIIAFALALLTFPRIRQIGVSILASAGIIGVIAGIAAQRSIANFIAGIQIALSQPIRIDDVVIVEGEWGVIEEITLTYVVVKIWDLRRLVVPIIYFLEKPFQNWTRSSSPLLGTVFLHTDYTVPVDELREELGRIMSHAPHWNGEFWTLHVTDAKERSLELRAIVSADSAPQLWELRCYVREKLVEYVKNHYPDSLPRIRAELQ